MPLNFPDNPTDNQEFNGYIYDATRGVWDVKLASDPLGSLNLTSPAAGEALVFNGTNWVNQEVATPASVKTIDSDTINIDFSDGVPLEKRTVAGNVTMSASAYSAGITKKVAFINSGAVPVTISFPSGWIFLTDKPTKIGAGVSNIIELESFGNSEASILAKWYGAIGFSPYAASGGLETTVEEDGVTYKVHTFTTGAVFNISEISETSTAEVLVVAGGGGGGSLNPPTGGANRAVGAGAGGLVYIPNFVMDTVGNYTIGVGAGGANFTNGSNSSISGGGRVITALGGGRGGAGDGTDNAQAGGSGGGNWYPGYPGAEATQTPTTSDGQTTYSNTGFGNPGGTSFSSQPYGAGGGGAGEPGGNWNGPDGPKGGDGLSLSISGTPQYYAGGGSSAGFSDAAYQGIYAGGLGGGGIGYNTSFNVLSNGTTNTGGGGGSGGVGGSGIVIIRYPITNPN
jgi:hypothetical protein